MIVKRYRNYPEQRGFQLIARSRHDKTSLDKLDRILDAAKVHELYFAHKKFVRPRIGPWKLILADANR